MRSWLYDRLTVSEPLREVLGGEQGILTRVMPRQDRENILVDKPFLMYGLGNSTDEGLEDPTANDARAERQFFQIWVHDEGGDYSLIDDICLLVRAELTGAIAPDYEVITVKYLETSGEFSNETYGTLFRYIRFQAIKGKALTP